MTGATGLVDFFALEAGDYLERMDELLAQAGPNGPEREAFARHARSLRGSATMARQTELAELAAALERIAAAHRDGSLAWTARVGDSVVAGIDEFKRLLRAVRNWTPDDAARARARAAELAGLLPTTPRAGGVPADRVVPIRTLFHDDAGPHVLERAPSPPLTADQRFRQAARPLAEALRAHIAEARKAGDGSDGVRETLGADLRGALRDLRELAESYDIQPVVQLALPREEPIGRLEPRALATIEAAAGALVGSATAAATAAATRPGSTPPTASPAAPAEPASAPAAAAPAIAAPAASPVSPPAPAAAAPPGGFLPSIDGPSPATPRAASATPPSGSALRALLQSSIADLDALGDRPIAEMDLPPLAATTALDDARSEPGDGTVPVESLLYRGRSALARAREVRDELRSRPGDVALLDELFDLLDLAAVE